MTKEELKKLEDDLWETADNLRANSDLKSSEYSTPILGIIFLKFADNKYKKFEKEIQTEYEKLKSGRRSKDIKDIAIEKCGFYLPEEARYDHLLKLRDDDKIANAIKNAMELIEKYNEDLIKVLPKEEYTRFNDENETNQSKNQIPKRLLQNFSNIPENASGDIFGKIYEYFLGKFALAEGQGGGEFFTPNSVVKLMVEIIEPHGGTVYDPACGSGGMFVQSAKFVQEHINYNKNNTEPINVSGQEKTGETVKLAKMNLFVNGIKGEIKQANTYSEDPFGSYENFDYVLANPPFNVDEVPLSSVENDKRFNKYGIPRNTSKSSGKDSKGKKKNKDTVPNANYLWINLFATSLKPKKGRAALVMANSASDARHSEAEIRKKLIEQNIIYGMLTLPSNMFYTVTLPATLWFFDKAKKDKNILFIDARNIFTQIDRAHREFSEEQIQNIAIISKLHKGNRKSFAQLVHSYFTKGFALLNEHKESLQIFSKSMLEYFNFIGKKEIIDFKPILQEIDKLEKSFHSYKSKFKVSEIDKTNKEQKAFYLKIEPFFQSLHSLLKTLDQEIRELEKGIEIEKDKEKKKEWNKKNREIKSEQEKIHKEAKDMEYYFSHIGWLQDRFPDAKYEDVTGLCKSASPSEVEEQEYSLNPGRYVGVVIEEDGKTEEEFMEEILSLNEEFKKLNVETAKLEKVIVKNVGVMFP